ncbi:hypothetical protein C2E23DRAFT_25189 [Lenzites betulinus]|nr:hypothetical protein C2E23DRAFT_25189 [Lenzites betulinus]
MVVRARRYRTSEGCKKQCTTPNERDNIATTGLPMAPCFGASDAPPARGQFTAHSKRTHALSLTLTYWTPVKHHDSSGNASGPTGDVLTARISGPRSRVMTSALGASPLRPLTMAEPTSRNSSFASSQHATDRFPRSTHLLRTGTPKPEAEGGLERRSAAETGQPQEASLATIPDPPAQRGTGDTTCLQSCVASDAGSTWGPSFRPSSSPPRASTPTLPAGTLASVSVSAPASAPLPLLGPALYTMASNSPTTPRTGSSTQRLPVPTRRASDAIAGDSRIMPGTPLSTSPQSQGSSEYADGGDADDLPDDAQAGTSAEGQPKKRKTRRAGVAITRVRRMQREVRRLAEEEELASQRQQPPQRSLLSGVQGRPNMGPPAPGAPPPLSLHIPQYSQQQQQQMRALASPSTLSATRPSAAEGRHARSEPSPAALSRAAPAAAYDQPPRTATT